MLKNASSSDKIWEDNPRAHFLKTDFNAPPHLSLIFDPVKMAAFLYYLYIVIVIITAQL